MKLTRREFVKRTAVAGAGVALLTKYAVPSARAVNNSDKLTKWIQPMRGLGPTGIPVMTSVPDPVFPNTDLYQIAVGEYSDVLHPQFPGGTKLWGYRDATKPITDQRHLGGVIIATRGRASRIRFTNTLPAGHIIPVDPTVMVPGTAFSALQNRTATHLHGGLVPWVSDGGPFDWFSPTGASGLSFPNGPGSLFDNLLPAMVAGQADYFYPNDQATRLLWYHDHAYGITRINAYAGIATAYLIMDPAYDAAKIIFNTTLGKSMVPGLASTNPLVFQDKKFVSNTTALTDPTWAAVMTAQGRPDLTAVGSLWYEHIYDPRQFRMFNGKGALPPPNPSCIPEFFGDTMLTNGLAYPLATVEAKRYRFLILNACNARFLNINLLQVAPAAEVATNPKTLFANLLVNPPGPPIIQIGNEAGYLDSEVIFPNNRPFNPALFTGNLLIGTGERADVIIDFTGKAGQEFVMYNDAPGPFPVGPATNDYFLGNPANPVQPLAGTGPDTRQILRIKVVAGASDPQPAGPILNKNVWDPKQPTMVNMPAVIPAPPLPLAPLTPLPAFTPSVTRNLTLNEDFDPYGRLRQLLGTTLPALVGKGFGLDYLAPTTETPVAGAVEVWNIFNLTADTHPIHFHLVNVQVLSRQPFKMIKGGFTPTGVARGPELNELGWKETVQMHPGEVTSVIMKFDLPPVPFNVPPSPRTGGNEYVWHCHILEHEEHDMMRPLVVSGANPVVTALAGVPYAAFISSIAGGVANFNIINGTASYTVVSSDPNFVVAATVPNSFSVTAAAGLVVGTVATITITDAAGLVANVTVTIV